MGRNDNINSNLDAAVDHARDAGHHAREAGHYAREAVSDMGRDISERLDAHEEDRSHTQRALDDVKHGEFREAFHEVAESARAFARDHGIISDDRGHVQTEVDDHHDFRDLEKEENERLSSNSREHAREGEHHIRDNYDSAKEEVKETAHGFKDFAKGESERLSSKSAEAGDHVRDRYDSAKEEVKEKAHDLTDFAKEESERVFNKSGEYARDAAHHIRDGFESAKEGVKDKAHEFKDFATAESERASDRFHRDRHTDGKRAKESISDAKHSVSDKIDAVTSGEHFTAEEFAEHATTQAGDHADASAIHFGEYAEQAEHDIQAFIDPASPKGDSDAVKAAVSTDLDESNGDHYYDAAMLV